MPQLRDIKRRIRSVKNTQQITRAMKMVAAAKLRRAQDSMLAMRPYASRLNAILRYLALDLIGDEHVLFRPRETKRVLTIVIAGDRGLCGGFNTNILRRARQHLADLGDVDKPVIAIGKRAISNLRKGKYNLEKTYYDIFEDLSYLLSGEICDMLVERYTTNDESARIDETYLVYNRFESVIQQTQVVQRVLPIRYEELVEERKAELKETPEDHHRPIYEIDPDIETALSRLIGRRLSTQVYHALLESYAAELAARMTAMDNATNNAGDMIERLTMQYNRARQTAITAELMDIVGGANALE